jgi:hypothetical protein
MYSRHWALMRRLGAAAIATPLQRFSGQAVSLTLNAMALLGFDYLPLLVHLCRAGLMLDTRELSPRHAATLMNALARLGAQFARVTGTEAQIITQKALLQASRMSICTFVTSVSICTFVPGDGLSY